MLLNALSILNVNSFSTACYVEAINSMHTINLFYLTEKTGFSLKTLVYEHLVSDFFLFLLSNVKPTKQIRWWIHCESIGNNLFATTASFH